MPDDYADPSLTRPAQWQKDLECSISDQGYTFIVSESGSLHVAAYSHAGPKCSLNWLPAMLHKLIAPVINRVVSILTALYYNKPICKHELLRFGIERAVQLNIICWRKTTVAPASAIGFASALQTVIDGRSVLIRQHLGPKNSLGFLLMPTEYVVPTTSTGIEHISAPAQTSKFLDVVYGHNWQSVVHN